MALHEVTPERREDLIGAHGGRLSGGPSHNNIDDKNLAKVAITRITSLLSDSEERLGCTAQPEWDWTELK